MFCSGMDGIEYLLPLVKIVRNAAYGYILGVMQMQSTRKLILMQLTLPQPG